MNPAFLRSKKLSCVIFFPALTLIGSNCLFWPNWVSGLSRYGVMFNSLVVCLLVNRALGLATEAYNYILLRSQVPPITPLGPICCNLYHLSHAIVIRTLLVLSNNISTYCLGYCGILIPILVAFHMPIFCPSFVCLVLSLAYIFNIGGLENVLG